MDVRFLPNPHWEDDLRPLTGHDPKVRDFVLETAVGSTFVDQFDGLLGTLVPQYQAEGRSYLTVAIGCTGGRHRSVAVAEELAARLRQRGVAVRTSHRDVSPLTVTSPGPTRAVTRLGSRGGASRYSWRWTTSFIPNARRHPHDGSSRHQRLRTHRPQLLPRAKQRGADIDFVAVNDLGSLETMAHLLKYDSVLGRFPDKIKATKTASRSTATSCTVLSERDPKNLPWGDLGVDVVIESTGFFTKRDARPPTSTGGAPLVIVSAPCDDADATFVYGVNHKDFDFKTSTRSSRTPAAPPTASCRW